MFEGPFARNMAHIKDVAEQRYFVHVYDCMCVYVSLGLRHDLHLLCVLCVELGFADRS